MAYDQILIAAAALIGLVVIAASTLKGWQGWLDFKARELEHLRDNAEPGTISAPGRIEVADLKERVRKLEAIAAGVDL